MKVIQFDTFMLPGKMPGSVSVQFVGLGDDGVLYVWNLEEATWDLFVETKSKKSDIITPKS